MAKKSTSPHERTEYNAKQVEAMSAYGVPQDDIAKVLGISKNTLRKYYLDELDTAAIKANAKIAGKLYEKAMSGDSASIFFWLKTRAKWKETHAVEHTGADGAALSVFNFETLKPKNE